MAFGAVLGLALGLSACAGGDSDLSYTRESRAPQTFPANYKADLLSLLRTYLTDPTGVREAALADPAPRDIRGRSLYAACLRYNAKSALGRYQGVTQRLAIFVDGRLDSIVETGADGCASAAYAPFPEMERLTR